MKKALLIVAGIALFAGPALAQTQVAQNKSGMKAQAQEQKAPRLFAGPGITDGNAVYDCTGKYLGSDPDPHVRSQMLRDDTSEACH